MHFLKHQLSHIRTFFCENKLLVVVLLLTTILSFYNLSRASMNNDAQLWYFRTENFYDGLQTGQLNETYQNPKPGVTVMWVSGFGLETFKFIFETLKGYTPGMYDYHTFWLSHFMVISPLVLISLSYVYFSYFILKRLFSKQLAFFSVVLLSSQPFYIGLSQTFHADNVLTAFMAMSVLAMLYYFSERRPIRWLVFSGVLAGLALLSKSSAIFLLPYFFLVVGLQHLQFFSRPRLMVTRLLRDTVVWLVSLAGTFFVLFPAMWLKPIVILRRIFVDEGWHLVVAGRDGVNSFWYYIEPFFRIVTPVLVLTVALGVFLWIYYRKAEDTKVVRNLFFVFCFIFFFILQMSLVKQKMERYILPILPFLAIYGGYALGVFWELLQEKYRTIYSALVVLVSFTIILYFVPNYLLFASMPGKDQFGCSLCAQIGDYLNSRPNGEELKIISASTKVHRLRPYVKGKVYTVHETLPYNWTPEYLVAARNEPLPEKYAYCWHDISIGFRGVDYWDIYKCK